ncbi:hypothetical protein DMENIID0001_059950 [Sergentomyia squamirostris]
MSSDNCAFEPPFLIITPEYVMLAPSRSLVSTLLSNIFLWSLLSPFRVTLAPQTGPQWLPSFADNHSSGSN